jgi:hypothetical protein
MKPGKSKAGDFIEQGVQNEDQAIAELPKYVNSFSGGVFSVSQKVWNMVCYFGVIVIHVQHLRMVYFNY